MATIKSYTDIEQSMKLAEILPIESCDVSDFDGAFYIVETNYHLSIESVYNEALKYALSNLI